MVQDLEAELLGEVDTTVALSCMMEVTPEKDISSVPRL
jgi:hypothetical protein